MEATPSEVRTDHIRGDILALPEVEAIDDFHVWALAGDKFFLSAHIALKEDLSKSNLLKDEDNEAGETLRGLQVIRKVHAKCQAIAVKQNICHSTFQIL